MQFKEVILEVLFKTIYLYEKKNVMVYFLTHGKKVQK